MSDERGDKSVQDVQETSEQRTEAVGRVQQPADLMETLRELSQSAPRTGQVQISAAFTQAVDHDAWTPENLGAAIAGMVRQNDQTHDLWRRWYRISQNRFYVEYVILAALLFGGLWLAVAGYSWGLYLVTAATSFYAGVLAGRGQK